MLCTKATQFNWAAHFIVSINYSSSNKIQESLVLNSPKDPLMNDLNEIIFSTTKGHSHTNCLSIGFILV